MRWKFAGRFFSSIDDAVDGAQDEAAMHEMLARYPEDILKRARWHLVFHIVLSSGDHAAVERLGMLIDCWITGLVELCDCGRLEGEHSKFSEACPDTPGYFIPKQLADSLNGFPDYHTSVGYRQGR